MADADIEINKHITYSSDLTAPITPLTIVNKSEHYYIFKVSTYSCRSAPIRKMQFRSRPSTAS